MTLHIISLINFGGDTVLKKIIALIYLLVALIQSIFGFFTKEYTTRELLDDPDFKNGFTVVSMETDNGNQIPLGDFTYSQSTAAPCWTIAQWNSKHCLWRERIESDIYTITDGKTKSVTYDPDNNALSMRLNAANIYCGEPAPSDNWPHLLIEQSPFKGYSELSDADKLYYRCDSDKIILSLDVRIKDFNNTTNPEGVNAAQFLAYLYIRGINSDDFIWFGLNLFDDRGLQKTYWNIDTAGSNNMIYSLSTVDTFGSSRKALFRNGKPYVSDEWTHIELDLTKHLNRLMRKANSSKLYDKKFRKEDFYISGTNVGFEIHGNYDCTFEIKNYRLTSYIST